MEVNGGGLPLGAGTSLAVVDVEPNISMATDGEEESTLAAASSSIATKLESWNVGDPVWFEPPETDEHFPEGLLVPGIVTDYNEASELATIESLEAVDGKQLFHVQNSTTGVLRRTDFVAEDGGQEAGGKAVVATVEDMVRLGDLHQSSIFWNIYKRYEQQQIYTFIGNILVSVNPYKMFDIYGLNVVKKYQNQMRTAKQSPHLFAVGNLAYSRMVKDGEHQSILIMGETGSGKTENTKLLLQYLAAINKSRSNIITEQILESMPLLESFGNAKTTKNNNSSRYCKLIEIFFNNGVINSAKTIELLHEKSRIVAHNKDERNFHIFYELLAGLSEVEKEKYGLQDADKYFYLNQGDCTEIDGKDDAEDFRYLQAAMQVLGFTNEEQDIIFRILASVLHLGNVYFHRKQFRHGQEGVEIGSDAEIRWVSHLLQLPIEDIYSLLTLRGTFHPNGERTYQPLSIEQALDMRDALSKVLYVSLFTWLVQRINSIVYKATRRPRIAILDMFGFECLKENNFEQLCINYASETLHQYYIRCVFRLEQAEFAKEKVDWVEVVYPDNQNLLALISRKPTGILPLLDDECNFPKATDASFLEKCHYSHALNELYSRARSGAQEFGIRHFEGQVWYSVEGFLEKNRNILKADVIEMLLKCKMPIMNKIFHYGRESADTTHRQVNRVDGRFITVKPRTPTVSAKFQEQVSQLFETITPTNPWFIRCIRPNDERRATNFVPAVVYEQLRNSSLVETILVRRDGYPVRLKYAQFVSRYRCLLNASQLLPRGTASKEVTRWILEKRNVEEVYYKFGFSKIFLKEPAESQLEREKLQQQSSAAIVLQAQIRGYLARRRYRSMRRGVVRIQSAFRAYRQRRDYDSVKRGVTRLQATWRMRRQQREYDRLRKAKAKKETERVLQERLQAAAQHNGNVAAAAAAAVRRASGEVYNGQQQQQQQHPENGTGRSSSAADYFDTLPEELDGLFSELDSWKCVHAYSDIVKLGKSVLPLKPSRNQHQQLPADIDQYSFAKFTNIYFRSQSWGAKHEPIRTPFLQKGSEHDHQEALAVFRLIMRFMNNEDDLSGKKEKMLADYIVQKGLANLNLRDEILCQLANQTWHNEFVEASERGWLLMCHCLAAFAPSPLLWKYLLKHVSDHAPLYFRSHLQRLLLSADQVEPYNSRAYPGSLLEWKANLKKCGIAMEFELANGDTKHAQVEPWTTVGDVAGQLLQAAGLHQNSFGWSVDFEDDGDIYLLNGDDYLLDMVSQMELLPTFPASKNYFVGHASRNRAHRSLLNPYHNPEMVNKFNVEGIVNHRLEDQRRQEQQQPQSMVANAFKSSLLQRELNQKMRRSLSGEALMNIAGNDFGEHRMSSINSSMPSLGLALGSKLNERYVKNLKAEEHVVVEEEPVVGNIITAANNSPPNEPKEEQIKLSERSRLNQRYITSAAGASNGGGGYPQGLNKKGGDRKALYTRKSDKKHQSKLNQRSVSMQELGLAMTSLNIRYFSREKLNKAASLTGGSEEEEEDERQERSLPKVQSLVNFGNNAARKLIRPSNHSSSPSSAFDSDETGSINNHEPSPHKGGTPEATKGVRYKKKSSGGHKLSRSQQYLPSNSGRGYCGTSAMSDTSEAPSLASHVRNVRIPSHNSELDQYLDDLFNPVLDANLDDAMSDARSLAQSIKGNGQQVLESMPIDEKVATLGNNLLLARQICGGVGGANEVAEPSINLLSQLGGAQGNLGSTNSLTGSNLQLNLGAAAAGLDPALLQQQVLQQQMYQQAFLASSLQQNLEIQKQLLQQNQQLQQLLAQHVPISPPPPLSTNGGGDLLLNRSTPASSFSSTGNLLANLPKLPVEATPVPSLLPSTASKDSSSSGGVPYKIDIIGNSKQILNTPANNSRPPNNNNKSALVSPPPPPPPPPEPTGGDLFGSRAKTVRIGKWRWPPPSDEATTTAANFIEFKRKKQIERQSSNNTGNAADETVEVDGRQQENNEKYFETPQVAQGGSALVGKKKSEDMFEDSTTVAVAVAAAVVTSESDKNDQEVSTTSMVGSRFASRQTAAPAVPGSIGKLRISMEMRTKLEQLTIDQSVRSRRSSDGKEGAGLVVVQSQSMDDLANMGSVKKLSEQRKALLERQLMGSLRNSNNFMETASTPNIQHSLEQQQQQQQQPPVMATSQHLMAAAPPPPHQHRKLIKENSAESSLLNNAGAPSSGPAGQPTKKFIKNQQQQLLRKSGSREFRERKEELGFSRQSIVSSVSEHHQHHPQQQLGYTHRALSYNGWRDHTTPIEDCADGPHLWTGRSSAAGAKKMSMPPPPPPPRNEHHHHEDDEEDSEGPVASHQHHQRRLVTTKVQAAEGMEPRTRLYPKNDISFYAYSKPAFKLGLRKEVFTPSETLGNPIVVDLIFWQIVADVYTPTGACLRLTETEAAQLQRTLKAEGVHGYNPSVYSTRSAFKKTFIETVREMPNYFARLYVVSGGRAWSAVDYLGVTHAGINLLKRDRTLKQDCLTLLERVSFDDISEVLIPNSCTLQLVLANQEWITLYSNKAIQMDKLIKRFLAEHQHSNVEYVRTLRDFATNEESMLSFKKDTIIRVVRNRNLNLNKGWLFGVHEYGESGLFQATHVTPVSGKHWNGHQASHSHHNQPPRHMEPTNSSGNSGQSSLELNGSGGSAADSSGGPGSHLLHNGHGTMSSYQLNNGHSTGLWIDSTGSQRNEEPNDYGKHLINGGAGGGASLGNGNTPDGNFSLLQFALFNFRESLSKYDLRGHLKEGSIRGSIKMIENIKSKKSAAAAGGKSKAKSGAGLQAEASNDWTWSEFANLVKYSKSPIESSLLMVPSELNKVATECFAAIMRYMGDMAMLKNQNEVDCVYTILLNCHRFVIMRDEVYCQLMKQTTSNKSPKLDSCQRGWRLFSIVAAYFKCSETLRPYLFKYLETAAYDKRRAFHVTANFALKNLKKTFKYGGRKNVPSIEEIAAISAGRCSKRQMYRLPGGTERVLNTTCTTVVADIIEEICLMINVNDSIEMEEFSLYCIIQAEPYTMPLSRDEYILDVTTELLKNGQHFYLIFCRSVWFYPLRLDSHLYIEVVFNQVAPDYLEGLLIIVPADEKLPEEMAEQIARLASLLHRAAKMDAMPTKDEIKFLLPKPIIPLRSIKPAQWVEMVQNHWHDMSALTTIEAKAQCLDILQKWPLFGSCFFAVKRIHNDSHIHPEHILALNKEGVYFLDVNTHEKVWKHTFTEVITTRKVRSEDGTLYLDMKCGNLMVQKITRIQTDQAHEISRLIAQYTEIEQHFKSGRSSASLSNEDRNHEEGQLRHHSSD